MRSLRFLLTLSSIIASSALALADPTGIAPGAVPPACASLASVPTDATGPVPSIAARISAASCAAEVKFNGLHLAPDDASIAALSDAAKPSVGWLDAAIQQNDPVMTPIAQKARADLFVSMAVRMRNSIAPITMQTVGPKLAEHDQQHAALEPKIKAWLDQSH